VRALRVEPCVMNRVAPRERVVPQKPRMRVSPAMHDAPHDRVAARSSPAAARPKHEGAHLPAHEGTARAAGQPPAGTALAEPRIVRRSQTGPSEPRRSIAAWLGSPAVGTQAMTRAQRSAGQKQRRGALFGTSREARARRGAKGGFRRIGESASWRGLRGRNPEQSRRIQMIRPSLSV
jgi:hypothetical protein